jgi:hypothetical protein
MRALITLLALVFVTGVTASEPPRGPNSAGRQDLARPLRPRNPRLESARIPM